MMEHPIPDSYWVIPGKLLAGEYPGDIDDVAARRKLNTLLDAGVTAFIDLTETGEHDLRPYWPLVQDLAEQRSIAVSYRRLSIADFAVPTRVSMAAILDTIDEMLAGGQIVYVHCFGGIGRTGTVVGCFLVRQHGMTGEQALAEIAARRAGTADAGKRSPETPAQRALVLAWGADGAESGLMAGAGWKRVGMSTPRAEADFVSKVIELELTAMAAGGEALGRYEGLVVFVPCGLPGEIVRVRLVEHKRHFARGAIVDVLKAAPERVTPSCRHFGVCGGCDWQFIDYATQLRFKTAIVREQLQRIGKLEEVEVRPCIPSPQPYHYRNHARLAVGRNGRLGYRAARSHAVISVEECPILESELTEVLGNAFVQPADSGFSEVVLYAWEEAIDVAGVRYRVSPGVFFQANTAVAELLIDEVLAGLALSGSERVLDLFCGVGLFTVPLAQRAACVVGVEAHPAAAADAQFNLATARIAGTILVADVGVALVAADIEQTRWDVVVLDPPRTGIDGTALARLAELAAPRLVYVSCDPATLARDVRYLCEDGYRLAAVQPFDMFPQTHHVETVAWLNR